MAVVYPEYSKFEWNSTYLSPGPGNHYGFKLIKTEIIATESTESTEEHEKINAL